MESIWRLNSNFPRYDSLSSDIRTDVAIIGGGITGILITYMLKKQGIDCVLIESNQITKGVTQNTTAKITCQHGLIYNKIINQFGLEKAMQYAKANQDALHMYRKIISTNNIDCSFEAIPTYLYTTESTPLLESELVALEDIGFKGSLTAKTSLPFEVQSALKMEDQAQFNPLAFLSSIAANLTIYENTQAMEVEGNTVTTPNGKISANQIVIATHFPFINTPGYYFMRMHQERSYVTAFKGAGTLDGAYLGIDDISYSFRTYKDMILLGGYGHRTGENKQGGIYTQLTQKSLEFYPSNQQISSWSAQDCMTHDGIPYIGKYSGTIDNLYVATGFNKWGMTSSMVAAMILSDMISGRDNDVKDVFSPQRHNLMASAKNLVVDGFEAVSGLAKQTLSIPEEQLHDIKLGHGGIVEHEGEKVGIYKKNNQEIYIVSTKCPHLGCQLAWNPDELSWDCPCHGSRFDYEGNILNNPAQKGLAHEKRTH